MEHCGKHWTWWFLIRRCSNQKKTCVIGRFCKIFYCKLFSSNASNISIEIMVYKLNVAWVRNIFWVGVFASNLTFLAWDIVHFLYEEEVQIFTFCVQITVKGLVFWIISAVDQIRQHDKKPAYLCNRSNSCITLMFFDSFVDLRIKLGFRFEANLNSNRIV